MYNKQANRYTTQEFRLSFPNLLKPVENTLSTPAKMEYNCLAIFEKAKAQPLIDLVDKMIKDAWPKLKDYGAVKNPIKSSDSKVDDDGNMLPGYVEGGFHATFKNSEDHQPDLFDEKLRQVRDAETLYAGCYCRAEISISTFEHKNDKGVVVSRGVSFYLKKVKKDRDGEPLGGKRTSPEEAFGAVAEEDLDEAEQYM